jgi:hypothetical protein
MKRFLAASSLNTRLGFSFGACTETDLRLAYLSENCGFFSNFFAPGTE